MDLADELMNDLENDSGDEFDVEDDPTAAQDGDEGGGAEGEGEMEVEDEVIVPEGGIKPAQELDQDQVDQMELKSVAAVSQVAKLSGSKTMREVLAVSWQAQLLPGGQQSKLDVLTVWR
jgi:U4/U6 small nuclear ribonucleoprotein PRP31